MDEILHRFETMGHHSWLVFAGNHHSSSANGWLPNNPGSNPLKVPAPRNLASRFLSEAPTLKVSSLEGAQEEQQLASLCRRRAWALSRDLLGENCPEPPGRPKWPLGFPQGWQGLQGISSIWSRNEDWFLPFG